MLRGGCCERCRRHPFPRGCRRAARRTGPTPGAPRRRIYVGERLLEVAGIGRSGPNSTGDNALKPLSKLRSRRSRRRDRTSSARSGSSPRLNEETPSIGPAVSRRCQSHRRPISGPLVAERASPRRRAHRLKSAPRRRAGAHFVWQNSSSRRTRATSMSPTIRRSRRSRDPAAACRADRSGGKRADIWAFGWCPRNGGRDAAVSRRGPDRNDRGRHEVGAGRGGAPPQLAGCSGSVSRRTRERHRDIRRKNC